MFSHDISIIKLRDVLLVAMPQEPGDETIQHLQEEVLQSMERHEPRGVILDATLVEIVDSFFARMLIETARMVALMGGRTIIAGIRPHVAAAATQLGLELRNIETALDVDRALTMLEEPYEG
jgi:rsbT antagonist protein RsbS